MQSRVLSTLLLAAVGMAARNHHKGEKTLSTFAEAHEGQEATAEAREGQEATNKLENPIQAGVVVTFACFFLNVIANLKTMNQNNFAHKVTVPEEGAEFKPWVRIAGNQQENLPYALIIFWGTIITSRVGAGSAGNIFESWQVIFMYTFVGARVAFQALYAFQLQPWRSLSYVIGQVCQISMAVIAVRIAFKFN